MQGEKQGQAYGCHHHLNAKLVGHDEGVVQWVADGHIAIICHHCQQKAVNAAKSNKEEHLGSTASQWNGLLRPPNVGKHQGHHHSGVAHFQEGEVAQEEVHGCVEGAVCADHPDDGRVATEDHEVEEEEEKEEKDLEFRDSGEHPEDKLGRTGLVEDRFPSQHLLC